MTTEKIRLGLTEEAANVLHKIGITPENYGPAYEGESVGLDLYNCGENISIPSLKKWHVFGEPTIVVPTGVKVIVPKGYVAFIKERSSIVKTPLSVRAGVIDPGYTGEIFVNLVNIGDRDVNVEKGAMLPVQLVVIKCQTDYEVVSNLEFLELTKDSKRQQGSVGSSVAAPPSTNNPGAQK